MNNLINQNERFKVETTREFANKDFHVKIEQVRDTLLKKEWYYVIWTYIPTINILPRNTFKFMHLLKSKLYKNESNAIQHFNEMIKSHLL